MGEGRRGGGKGEEARRLLLRLSERCPGVLCAHRIHYAGLERERLGLGERRTAAATARRLQRGHHGAQLTPRDAAQLHLTGRARGAGRL